jgi:hypothetical protein
MISCGGRSSVGRAQDCDSCGRGFDPLRPPQFQLYQVGIDVLKLSNRKNAKVAELVDALVLGTSIFDVRVRVSPFAPCLNMVPPL